MSNYILQHLISSLRTFESVRDANAVADHQPHRYKRTQTLTHEQIAEKAKERKRKRERVSFAVST